MIEDKYSIKMFSIYFFQLDSVFQSTLLRKKKIFSLVEVIYFLFIQKGSKFAVSNGLNYMEVSSIKKDGIEYFLNFLKTKTTLMIKKF